MKRTLIAAAALAGALTTATPTQQPDVQRPRRFIPPNAQISVTDLRVRTAIVDGVASTEIHQTFHNRGGRDGEADWILPLPKDATADHFEMIANGVEMPSEVLGAGRARHIYEEIVRQRRDPGLLEYAGSGCLRARVFPIPANGEVQVVVRYRQILPETSGLHEWRFPLRAAAATGYAPARVTFEAKLESSTPIKTVYSPLGSVDIQRRDDHCAVASYESAGAHAPRDLELFYGLSRSDFGLHLLTHRHPEHPGYFLMMLAPKHDWPVAENTRKVIHFVLDTSGSMKGVKIQQARDALRFFLQSLSAGDRFNVVPFSTEARPFFPGPVVASPDNLKRALARVDEIEARGGTNIEDALSSALSSEVTTDPAETAVPITVFLTDGLPTVGVTDVNQLIAHIGRSNTRGDRIFVFGVGHDVNSRLLDTVAEQSRGDRDYVREHESIEVKTGALFTKLSHPVLTDVELRCDAVDGFDQFPKRAPDLFKGSRLLVAGRYRGAGNHAIHLSGMVNGKRREFVFEGYFPKAKTEHDFVPALWAERKVGFLLDQIRLHGAKKELVDEVTRIGREFGVVTPYTSHLVLEENARLSRARGVRADGGDEFFMGGSAMTRVQQELVRAGAPSRAAADLESLADDSRKEAEKAKDRLDSLSETEEGKKAVDNSLELRRLAGKARAGYGYTASGGRTQLAHRRLAGRSFFLVGGAWVDAAYTDAMKAEVKKVEAFSEDYFALIAKHPELRTVFAFSTNLVVVIDGQAYEIA